MNKVTVSDCEVRESGADAADRSSALLMDANRTGERTAQILSLFCADRSAQPTCAAIYVVERANEDWPASEGWKA